MTVLIKQDVHLGQQAVRLVLEDSTKLTGCAFGALNAVTGDVVVNTATVSYVETQTGPSYRGQTLTLT